MGLYGTLFFFLKVFWFKWYTGTLLKKIQTLANIIFQCDNKSKLTIRGINTWEIFLFY